MINDSERQQQKNQKQTKTKTNKQNKIEHKNFKIQTKRINNKKKAAEQKKNLYSEQEAR